jgi:hypothetical protein
MMSKERRHSTVRSEFGRSLKKRQQNDSKNRLKGTLELKSIVVTRDVMREYICEKVVPSIRALWPDNKETIFIKQDNARTHILRDDPMFLAAVKETG